MFMDVAALTLAYAGMALGGRAPTGRHTFGLARAEVLAAFVNAQLLLVGSGLILFEAWRRFRAPSPVHTSLMLGVAVVGPRRQPLRRRAAARPGTRRASA